MERCVREYFKERRMIQLEHVNLVVKDIPEMLTFYKAAFPHWYVRDEGKVSGQVSHETGYTSEMSISISP